jgi:hypothetical protein
MQRRAKIPAMPPAAFSRISAVAFLMAIAVCVMAPQAPAADKADPVFAKWWQKFQLAVTRRDVRTIDKGVEYPMEWEVNADVRAIRGESDLAANFGLFFTPEVMKNIAMGKPEKLPNGNYLLVWKARGNEYSLNFRYYNGTYVLDGLGEGPP